MTSRKRHRLSVVCSFCKKRKVKCDKGNPCSTCVKYGNANCHYDVQGVDVTNNRRADADDLVQGELELLKAKIKSLEESISTGNENNEQATEDSENAPNQDYETLEFNSIVGYNPVASPNDTINFYEGYTPIFDSEPMKRNNFGPLSWLSLIKIDPALSMLWTYVRSRKKNIKLQMDDNMGCGSPENQFRERESVENGYADVTLYKDTTKIHAETKNKFKSDSRRRTKINETAMSLGLTFYDGEIDDELELIQKIQLVLPTKAVIWKLIKRFFSHLYPFFAIIDELYFRSLISRILGPESLDDEKVDNLKIEKRLDFAYLGLLLIVLRLSYLSLFSNITKLNEANLYTNDPSPKAQEFKYLLSNPINIDVIDVAQLCLNQFNLLRKVNMATMQLAIFTRLYHLYAPEDGDGSDGGDSQVFTGMLIQMAISMGLNREPDKFPDECNDGKTNNLGRKIWYLLLISDVNNGMAMGCPLNTSLEVFDTKVPYYKLGNENVNDIELEKSVTSSFGRIEAVYGPLSKILQMILNVRGETNLTKLTACLNALELEYMKEYCSVRQSLKNETLSTGEMAKKTLKMKIYFTCHFFRVSLCFHFYNYYERKKNYKLSFFYLKKIFVITILDLMPFYHEMLETKYLVFKNSTDLVITPSFELAVHKSLVVLIATLIRVKLTLKYYQLSYNHQERLVHDKEYGLQYSSLKRLSELLDLSAKVFRGHISRLSSRYYYSWRISKAHSFLMETVLTDEFYEKTSGSSQSLLIHFTTPMLDELIKIFEKSLNTINRKHHRKRHHSETNVANSVPPYNEEARNSTDSASIYSDSSSMNDFNTNDVLVNDQIDSLWLNMMSLKNGISGPGKSQPDLAPVSGVGEINNYPNYNNFGFDGSNFGNDGYNSGSYDLFDALPLDELFKNLN